jgi:uncharacterized membrane protein YozB (DUF420 family)
MCLLHVEMPWVALLLTFFSYPFIFAETFGINGGLSNICFVGLFIGIALSALLVPIAYRKTVRQLEKDGDDGSGKAIHRESRLFFAMIGAPTLPIGLFWMGWTDYVSIQYPSPSQVLYTSLTDARLPFRYGHL